jgi:cell division septation protein DedD
MGAEFKPVRRIVHQTESLQNRASQLRSIVRTTPEKNMISKLKAGGYRLYSRKKNPKTGKRRNLGTFTSRAAAEKHERAVQYFKRH